MKKFLQNKTFAYWIAAGVALVSLIFSIIYVATYKDAIGNNGVGYAPESIFAFMLAGSIVEMVFLVLPQYAFINLIAIGLFALALYKEVFLVPDFIAGTINQVEYNGGNAGLNYFYLVMILVIMITAIVVCFFNVYKNKEEADADFKNVKGVVNISKLAGGAAIILTAILVSTITINNIKNATVAKQDPVVVKEKFNPITEEIKALAESKTPELDPTSVVFSKRHEYNFKLLENKENKEEMDVYNAIDVESSGADVSVRDKRTLIYFFEGTYSEGYQGQYNEYYTNLYLWDDGFITGNSNGSKFKGFWYNDEDANGIVEKNDKIGIVCDEEAFKNFKSIICTRATGFYEWDTYVYMNPGWGGRSIVVSGYMYYETIALAVDTTKTGVKFKVGDTLKLSNWTVNRILQNLRYGSVFDMPDGPEKMRTKWTIPEGLIENNKFAKSGEYELKVTWNGLETSVNVTVEE